MDKVFIDTLNQTLVLFLLIAAGYIIVKLGVVSADGTKVLSRLENTLIIPALVLGTFIENFTREKFAEYGRLFLLSFALFAVVLPIALLGARLIYKDLYLRKIATYGLSFANFGFMGNAVVEALYPDMFSQYTVFVIPLWIMIYLWGVPTLLLSSDEDKDKAQTSNGGKAKVISILKKLKPLLNPMFIAMLIGMTVGITGLGALISDSFVLKAVDSTKVCMSAIAMFITGMTIANTDILYILKNVRIYILSVVRLVLFPLLFILAFAFVPKNEIFDTTFLRCAICALSMPLGLNTIVVPGAYGKDTKDAAGMALISHLLAVITIPLVFMLFEAVVLKG